jgi:hypothetical protein
MRCFESHRPFGGLDSLGGGGSGVHHHHAMTQHDLDSVSRLVIEGKTKVQEIRSNLKNLESTSQRLHAQVRYISP